MSPQGMPEQTGGRLRDRTIVFTGAGGQLGHAASLALLREGARLVAISPHRDALDALAAEAAGLGLADGRLTTIVADLAQPGECQRVADEVGARGVAVDTLVNHAETAGPKQPLERIPFTREDLARLGETDPRGARVPPAGTMFDVASALVGGPWLMTRALLPHMATGGAIVNVSTVFAHLPCYGRIPYVVPKAALNALSCGLARELGRGERGLRVNTLLLGPVDSEQTRLVFEEMDRLKGVETGTTARAFLDTIHVRTPAEDGQARPVLPRNEDVVAAITWLASAEASSLAAQTVEMTSGMPMPAESRADLVSWPDMRLVDLTGRVVLMVGGADIDEALAYANAHLDRGAHVVLAFRQLEALERARLRVVERARRPLHLLQADPLKHDSVSRASRFLADRYGRLDAVLVLPTARPGAWGRSLATATEDVVRRFVAEEIVAPVAIASSLSAEFKRLQRGLKEPPAITFVTNRDDRAGNAFAEIARAGVEALMRVWRHEDEHDVSVGRRRFAVAPNQVIRFRSEEDDLAFTVDWALTLANRVRRMDALNLWVPQRIGRATGKSSTPLATARTLLGLHTGRSVVITGASAGIGAQLSRFLALAGARVLMAARDERKLEQTREEIVADLAEVGYPDPAQRVFV
ncbi:MAG: SDR family NAD(P)-dependent oxidoreductase, partial [Vicinamibacterales bacterium]|nr:SDR family NAD(P)-dependent oxidoreductase [Vicinamibacterales bacterium]